MVSNTLMAIAAMYWGIHNEGEPQRITIDHFTSGYVMGVKGEDIHLPPRKDGDEVVVAVLDTGIDSSHPLLEDVIAEGGYNFVANNNDITDTHGHGTHIAGIIATQVSKNARILPVKVVQTGPNAPIRPQEVGAGAGTALTENVAKGISYAVNHGAKVINLSLAWPNSIRSKAVDAAMAEAEKAGVLIIASAANDGTSANLYPCVYSNVICVGAHGPDGAFTYFSNYGSMVDLLAPGITILSTWPMDLEPNTFGGAVGHEFRNGTSMAAPFVAGAAAELISRGFSPTETKNRLLLGTRPTQTVNQFTTAVVGKFSLDQKKPTQFARFGNLDVSHALEVRPQSLILPIRKARTEIIWNGIDSTASTTLEWKNNWKTAKNVTITINGQSTSFPSLKEGQIVRVPVTIALNTNTESTFDLLAKVEALETNGSRTSRTVPVSFMVNRLISPATIPASATVYRFQTLDPRDYSSIRSVVNVDGSKDRELYLLRNNELVLTRQGVELGRTSFANVNEDRILNLYRLDENNYGLISTQQEKGEPRPSYLIKSLDSRLTLLNEVKLGTDVTVLNENFAWKKSNQGNSLLWVSIGYTPAAEKPKYNPWDKNYSDTKMPRIYYTEGKELHTISLADDELPLQVLPNGDILIAKGVSYYAKYFVLSFDLTTSNKISNRREISLFAYRMLLGLDGNNKILSLKGGASSTVLLAGASSPGNMRVTAIDATSAQSTSDHVLKRAGTLDSLVQISGAFSDLDQQYYFVQTHFQMKLFRSNSNETYSTSLNRFSYIPSMIFNRNFFPLVARDQYGNGIPGIYIPASLANANVSDIIIGNTKTGEVKKPAMFHFETSPDCMALGNLIPATLTEAAKQVFVCNRDMILVPIIAQQ